MRLDDAVAVVADHMGSALKGLAALSLEWAPGDNANFTSANHAAKARAAVTAPGIAAGGIGDPEGALCNAAQQFEAVYEMPLLVHAAMEPLYCTVHVRPDSCDVWVAFANGDDGDNIDGALETYTFANSGVDYVRHEGPAALQPGFWRGAGMTCNIFMVESFVDELAHLAGADPLEFRLGLLTDSPRAAAVLRLAAEKAGWGKPIAKGTGRGLSVLFGFGTYLAQVTEVATDASGALRVITCAVDCGMVVNPDMVKAQIEGGTIFGLSAALYGEITLRDGRVEQDNFDSYPVLRIDETPQIDVHLITSSENPGGVGEPGTAGIAPAVANAVFAATGNRKRILPLNRQI